MHLTAFLLNRTPTSLRRKELDRLWDSGADVNSQVQDANAEGGGRVFGRCHMCVGKTKEPLPQHKTLATRLLTKTNSQFLPFATPSCSPSSPSLLLSSSSSLVSRNYCSYCIWPEHIQRTHGWIWKEKRREEKCSTSTFKGVVQLPFISPLTAWLR